MRGRRNDTIETLREDFLAIGKNRLDYARP